MESHWTKSRQRLRDRATKERTGTATAKAFSNLASAESSDLDAFRTIALFCGVGLFVLLLLAAGLACLQLEPRVPDVMDWI